MHRIFYFLHRTASGFMHWVTLRLTPAGQLVAAAMGVTAAFGINTHINMAHQAFAFLTALAIAAVAASRFIRTDVSVTRRLPRYATVGEPVTCRLRVHNNGKTPLHGASVIERMPDPRPDWATYRDAMPEKTRRNPMVRWTGFYRWQRLVRLQRKAGAEASAVPAVPGRAEVDAALRFTPIRRGRLDLPGPMMTRTDPLGLFRTTWIADQRGSVVILPKRYRLPPSALPGRRHHQPGGVALASSVGDIEEFRSLRDYRPGDPRRRIHWKSWAKTGRPMVRETQEEFFVRHALVLDTFAAGTPEAVFEEAVSLAASVVTARGSETLLDLMFVGTQAYCFTSGRGLAHTERMLEILAGVTVCRRHRFDALTPLIVGRAQRLSACVCILLDWNDARRALVDALKRLGIPTSVYVIAAPGAAGDLAAEAPEDRRRPFRVLEAGRMQEGLDAP